MTLKDYIQKEIKKNKIELGTWNYLNDLPIMHIESKIKKENGSYATINFFIDHISLLIYDKDCKQNYVYLGKKNNSIFLENCDLSLFEIKEL